MSLSLQQLSDRVEIQDLLVRYTRAIDGKDWNLLDTCFTPDAHLDYKSSGGVAGHYPEVRAWLAKALALFPVTVHAISNSHIELDGDRATGRCYLDLRATRDGVSMMGSGYYEDVYVRTADGWKFRSRKLNMRFFAPLLEGWAETPPHDRKID